MSSGHDLVTRSTWCSGAAASSLTRIGAHDPHRTHYATLGVAPDASSEQIRAAYRDLARRLHPDRAASSAGVTGGDSMAAVNEAYRVLSDPGRRSLYDRSLVATPAGEPQFTATDDGDVSVPVAPRPNRLSPAGPARVPWRLMGATALIGSAAVIVSSLFRDPPSEELPDGLMEPGSCVELEVNGDAREVACTGDGDLVVRSLVPLDGDCPSGTVGHRDRLGLGIACVE